MSHWRSNRSRKPRDITEEMVSAFVAASKSLAEVSAGAEYFDFEKGLYAYLIVKPIKRISTLLSADRELLVLFSSFNDQQPRTIRASISKMKQSSVRLEKGIVIVVHMDPAGNDKLKSWGNEEDLAVLPIYYEQSIPQGEALERILLSEMFSHDVFNVVGPVSDDARFYGRRSEALDIARQLQTGQVRSCLGIRKVGKTSVINRIIDITTASANCINVMVDCSRDVVWQMDEAKLVDSISVAIDAGTRETGKCISVAGSRKVIQMSAAADGLLQSVKDATKPIIIYFDEVDYITPGSPVTGDWKDKFNAFWRNIRSVYQEAIRNDKKLSFYVCGVSSKWFCVESIAGVENAALSFIPEEYLGPLQTGASSAMIKALSRTAGLVFETKIAEFVAEACCNIPFWIRRACSYMHKKIPTENRPYTISIEEAESLIEAFIQTEGAAIADVALSHLFRVYPELAKPALGIAQGAIGGISASTINTLDKYGITRRKGGVPIVSGAMMSAGFKLYLEKETRPVQEVSHGIDYSNVHDWAEDLALIGAARNKLERRLRGAVLNFVRFDEMNRSSKEGLVVRLMKVIKPTLREQYKHLTAEELLEKYNWTDLIQVIEHEWPLFQKLFNDRLKFRQTAELVNKRYDAHAKEANKADIALYSQAVEWLGSCVDRI